MFVGYGDGLIMMWDITKILNDEKNQSIRPLLGHINRINMMSFEVGSLFSASQDCTVRQWNTETDTCTRVFKLQDPCTCLKVH